MNFLKFLRLKRKTPTDNPYPYEGILHLWEDDYLMIELLSLENLEFVKAETKRINNFGQEHFDGTGFTDITPISEKPVKTIEKLIDFSGIENIMIKAGLEKIAQFHMQGVGLIQADKNTFGFGTNKGAIMCEKQNSILENIWITGHTETEKEKQNLANALFSLGQQYNFIAVNWYKCEYYNLVELASVEEFVKNSC